MAKSHKKSHSVKLNRSKGPFLSFSWMLVMFLVLFLVIAVVIRLNSSKKRTTLMILNNQVTIPIQKSEIGWQEYRDAAIADVKKSLSQPPKAVKLLSFEKMDWSDSSLGCPKPGMMYTQVITPGYKLILLIDGKEYTYHAGSNYVVLCNR